MCTAQGQLKRVFTQNGNTGWASATNVGCDAAGNFFPIQPMQDRNTMQKPLSQCGNNVVLQPSHYNMVANQIRTQGFSTGIISANTQISGGEAAVRVESVAGSAQGFISYSITLEGSATPGDNNRIVLGDAGGTYALTNNPGVTDVNNTAGTFGTSSLSHWNTYSGLTPMRIVSMQIIASDETFFSAGLVRWFQMNVGPDGADYTNLNLQNLLTAEQYNPKIQYDNTNRIWNATTGLDITIPTGQSITLIVRIGVRQLHL